MSRFITACTFVLLLASVNVARADDDRELPAPDFGWSTLGIVLACGAGGALIRHRRVNH
jgi:hypothetical protein